MIKKLAIFLIVLFFPLLVFAGWQEPVRGTLLNKSHPIARSMVIALPLNEGTGTSVHDYASGKYSGTLINSPTWVAGGLDFERDNDQYIDFDSWIIPAGQPWTVAVRFKLESISNGTWQGIIAGDNASGDWSRVMFEDDTFMVYDTDNQDRTFDNSITPVVGEWTSVLVTSDGMYMDLYQDGLLVGVAPNVPGDVSADDWDFHTWANMIDNNYGLDGVLAYAYGWNRHLEAIEAATLHREPYCVFLVSPVARLGIVEVESSCLITQ